MKDPYRSNTGATLESIWRALKQILKYVAIAVTMGWDKEKNTVYVFIPSSRLSVCGSCVPHTRNVLLGSCADAQI